jgi:hypothetical protein
MAATPRIAAYLASDRRVPICLKEIGKPGWETLKPSGYTYSTPLPESYKNERWASGTPLPTSTSLARDAAAELGGPEANVRLLGLELPPAPLPAGMYRPVQRQGNLIYVSGHGPLHLVSCVLLSATQVLTPCLANATVRERLQDLQLRVWCY